MSKPEITAEDCRIAVRVALALELPGTAMQFAKGAERLEAQERRSAVVDNWPPPVNHLDMATRLARQAAGRSDPRLAVADLSVAVTHLIEAVKETHR